LNTFDQTLQRFTVDLTSILGAGLYDVILHGSSVLGDFRPHKGDIYYIVLTNGDLDQVTAHRLFQLHDAYRAEQDLLLDQLEGTFYPKGFISKLQQPFGGVYIGTTRTGWRRITTLQNSLMDLRVARTCGRSLLGHPIDIYNPAETELQTEMIRTLLNIEDQLSGPNGSSFGFIMSAVHWSARAMAYIHTRETLSKSAACRWVASKPDQQVFAQILAVAEAERLPYDQEQAAPWMSATCLSLLQAVAVQLPNPQTVGES
jgi:hypothetical protein